MDPVISKDKLFQVSDSMTLQIARIQKSSREMQVLKARECGSLTGKFRS